MAVFAIQIKEDVSSLQYLQETRKRLQRESLLHNPFNGNVKRWHQKGNNLSFYGLSITPIYPRIYLIGLLIALIPLIFTGLKFTVWNSPGLVLYAGGIFWSKYFYYVILKIGLRKNGFKGHVKLLNSKTMLERIILDR